MVIPTAEIVALSMPSASLSLSVSLFFLTLLGICDARLKVDYKVHTRCLVKKSGVG